MRHHLQPLRFLLAAFLLGALVACAQLGGTAATFNGAVANAIQATDTVVTGTRILLLNKKMSSADAESVLKGAESARDGIAIARQIHAANPTDPNAGMDRLQLAASIADQLAAYLATKNGGAPIIMPTTAKP